MSPFRLMNNAHEKDKRKKDSILEKLSFSTWDFELLKEGCIKAEGYSGLEICRG